LLQAVDPKTAAPYSRKLARSICSGSLGLDIHSRGVDSNAFVDLDSVLANSSRVEVSRRAAATAAAVGMAAHGPFAALASLRAASEPLPCRLSTQDLVELLKMPTCLGETRKVVLKHLGNRYGRPFANHWEFVRFAQEHHLDLDFTTPPKRPAQP
jgi:hypothetical protein